MNPSGQWRFVEDVTGQPITAAMARLLTGLVSTQSHPVLTRGHGDSVVVRPRVVGS